MFPLCARGNGRWRSQSHEEKKSPRTAKLAGAGLSADALPAAGPGRRRAGLALAGGQQPQRRSLDAALAGEQQALLRLEDGKNLELDDLFELIDNEDLVDWLAERRPELHLLFEAIQGSDDAAARLRARSRTSPRLVGPFRKVHAAFLHKSHNGNGVIEGGAAADMGCLIGEMHLRQGEHEKAVEAFTRAIESQPAADLYEGRARAYRCLAERDETRARDLRQRG